MGLDTLHNDLLGTLDRQPQRARDVLQLRFGLRPEAPTEHRRRDRAPRVAVSGGAPFLRLVFEPFCRVCAARGGHGDPFHLHVRHWDWVETMFPPRARHCVESVAKYGVVPLEHNPAVLRVVALGRQQ